MVGARRNPANHTVAERLGCSTPLISQYRTGRLTPSWAMMETIEKALGWPFEDQVNAKRSGTYSDEFESAVQSRWGR